MTNPAIENATAQLGFGAHVYERDVEHLKPESTTLQKAQRVAVMALPFLALYKPFGSAISIGMNTTRSVSCIFQTKEAFAKGDTKDQSLALFQTAIAAASVAGAIFGNVYGMAITSGHDVLVSLHEMYKHLEKARKGEEGEYEKAAEKFLQVVTNSLYLTVILNGSLEIIVLSFAAQILLEAYKSQGSFRKYFNTPKDQRGFLDLLEGFAHLGMAGVRGYQMAPMVQMLQFKLEIEKAIKEHEAKQKQIVEQPSQIADEKLLPPNPSVEQVELWLAAHPEMKKPIDAPVIEKPDEELDIGELLIRYENNPARVPAVYYAVILEKESVVHRLVEAGADINCSHGGMTALSKALCIENTSIAEYLLEHGAKINSSHFSICAVLNYTDSMLLLIKYGGKVDDFIQLYTLILFSEVSSDFLMCLFKNQGVVPELYKEVFHYEKALLGSDLGNDFCTATGLSLEDLYGDGLLSAAIRHRPTLVEILLDNGAEIHTLGHWHANHPLIVAISRGQEKAVELLLQRMGNNTGIGNYKYFDFLNNALTNLYVNKNWAILQLLIKNDGMRMHVCRYSDESPWIPSVTIDGRSFALIERAIIDENVELVALLLKNETDPNRKLATTSKSCLKLATETGNNALVDLLLEYGAKTEDA